MAPEVEPGGSGAEAKRSSLELASSWLWRATPAHGMSSQARPPWPLARARRAPSRSLWWHPAAGCPPVTGPARPPDEVSAMKNLPNTATKRWSLARRHPSGPRRPGRPAVPSRMGSSPASKGAGQFPGGGKGQTVPEARSMMPPTVMWEVRQPPPVGIGSLGQAEGHREPVGSRPTVPTQGLAGPGQPPPSKVRTLHEREVGGGVTDLP